MKRGIVTSLAVLLTWWSVGTNFASAQFGTLGQPPIRPRPTVSPYVNLGAGGGALSYYGLVRPQMDQLHQIQTLQSAMTQINPDGSLKGPLDQPSQTGQQTAQTGLQTGHTATYFNYSHYYPIAPPGGSNATTGLGIGLGSANPAFGSPFGGLGGGLGYGLGGGLRPFQGGGFGGGGGMGIIIR